MTESIVRGRLRLAYVCFFAGFFVLWTVLPLLIGQEVPGDNYEQLNWALSPAWGYAKHPPFPTWVLWIFEQVFPAGVLLTYFLGALQIAMVLGTTWLLARDTLGIRRAWTAVLMVACITYYTNRMHFYNHNTALLVASVGAVFALWRAVQSEKPGWWAALGVCWGIGMLCKYQMVVTIACNLAFLASTPLPQPRWRVKGVMIAAATAAVVVLPHVAWLFANHFPTFTYASKSLAANAPWSDRPVRELKFLADQVLRLVNLLAVLVALALVVRSRPESMKLPDPSVAARRLFAIHAFGPLVLMVLLSLLFGVELQMHWGTAFLWAIPLWIVATQWGGRVAALDPRVVLSWVIVAQVIMAVAYVFKL